MFVAGGSISRFMEEKVTEEIVGDSEQLRVEEMKQKNRIFFLFNEIPAKLENFLLQNIVLTGK